MTAYINQIPPPLLEDIVENRCIPIIGAGFSANAELPHGQKMPIWEDVGAHFASQLPEYQYLDPEKAKKLNPIDVISDFSFEFSRSKTVEQLRNILYFNRAQPGTTHLSFARLPFDIVITTNFDFLLEKSYEKIEKTYYSIVNEE
jgi:NAD-dependent SIR2 family protein deacetylase